MAELDSFYYKRLYSTTRTMRIKNEYTLGEILYFVSIHSHISVSLTDACLWSEEWYKPIKIKFLGIYQFSKHSEKELFFVEGVDL